MRGVWNNMPTGVVEAGSNITFNSELDKYMVETNLQGLRIWATGWNPRIVLMESKTDTKTWSYSAGQQTSLGKRNMWYCVGIYLPLSSLFSFPTFITSSPTSQSEEGSWQAKSPLNVLQKCAWPTELLDIVCPFLPTQEYRKDKPWCLNHIHVCQIYNYLVPTW